MTAATNWQSYFPPNPTKHGLFIRLTRTRKGEEKKEAVTHDDQPVTLELIARHLHLNNYTSRWRALGYLPTIVKDGKAFTTVGMIDLDAKTYAKLEPDAMENDRLRLRDVADSVGFHSYFEQSSRGNGWHVYLFTEDLMPLEKMAKVLRGWAIAAALHNAEVVEVYPMNGNHSGRWYIMPYAGAAEDKRRLGHTYLQTEDGTPIPFDELDEWITRTPNGLLERLIRPEKPQDSEEQAEHDNLTPDGLEALKSALLEPKEGFERHGSIVAALNLAERMGAKAEMQAFLRSEELRHAWITDGSRTADEWAEEVDRWAKAEGTRRYGFPYLGVQGFVIPRLDPESRAGAADSEKEIIVNQQVKGVVTELVAGLKALSLEGNPRIYTRGDGLLVEMQAGYKLSEVTKADSLKALLHDNFSPIAEKESKAGAYTVPAVFTNNHTALLLRKSDDFPMITTVSDIPLMLADGSILSEPGYHKEHGYFLNTVGIEVELMDVNEARDLFLQTFNEFSYQAPKAGFTATLAFTLQPSLMPVIDDITPLYAILGARRSGSGSGKGYLLDCVYRIHEGEPYSHDGAMPATSEECGKVLFAALSEGVSHIIFDDIEHLKHRELMAAITARKYKNRILGVSKRYEVSTAVTWAVSGNAPEIHRDFYRRIIPIYMNTGKARGWEKDYSNPNLHHDILKNRNRYISAVLSILEHWKSQGMPLSEQTIKGFDRWSAVMGGVLESIGLPDLTKARGGLGQLVEVDTSDLDLLVDAWRDSSLAQKKLKGKELLGLANHHNLLTELYENKSQAAGAAELGKYLKPFANDIFGEHYLRREFDSDSKTWRYWLEPVPKEMPTVLDILKLAPIETDRKHHRSTPVSEGEESGTGVERGSNELVSMEEEQSHEPEVEDAAYYSTAN